MMSNIVNRVFAVLSMDDDTCRFLGYGVREEDEIPIVNGVQLLPVPNPKITLDSGKVVWGCECWWGPEDDFLAYVGGRTIEDVDIDEVRAQQAVD